MKFEKIEHHQVNLTYTYDYDDEELVKEFGSVQRFKELLTQLGDDMWVTEIGDPATEEERDAFIDFVCEADPIDSEEDWWTARKGGYEVTWRISDDD